MASSVSSLRVGYPHLQHMAVRSVDMGHPPLSSTDVLGEPFNLVLHQAVIQTDIHLVRGLLVGFNAGLVGNPQAEVIQGQVDGLAWLRYDHPGMTRAVAGFALRHSRAGQKSMLGSKVHLWMAFTLAAGYSHHWKTDINIFECVQHELNSPHSGIRAIL